MISPKELKKKLPLNSLIRNKINKWHVELKNILLNNNKRKIIICGPCSIHNYQSSIEYAYKLKKEFDKYSNKLFIIMRVYFEKPRTTIGWKGLINDPNMNESFNINKGLILARKLLLEINQIGIPVGGEILDLNIANYLIDLFTWVSLGARTCESQIHREFLSNLNIPVGIKNTTDGNVNNAINSIITINNKHTFLGINENGKINILSSKGNKYGHLILRGGIKPNYYKHNVIEYYNLLNKFKLINSILIDCSHNNSNKKYLNQIKVSKYILKKKLLKENLIKGIMLESNLLAGNQIINLKNIRYGVSVTDECIDWKSTSKILLNYYKHLKNI